MPNYREPASDAATGLRDVASSATTAIRDAASSVSDTLKTVGVDTDVVASAAKDQATHLQGLLEAEIRNRPWQALALATFFGLWLGLRR